MKGTTLGSRRSPALNSIKKFGSIIRDAYMALVTGCPLVILDYVMRRLGQEAELFRGFLAGVVEDLLSVLNELLDDLEPSDGRFETLSVLRDNVGARDVVNLLSVISAASSAITEALKLARSNGWIPLRAMHSFTKDVVARVNSVAEHFVAREVYDLAKLAKALRTLKGVRVGPATWGSLVKELSQKLPTEASEEDIKWALEHIHIRYADSFKKPKWKDRTFLAHTGLTYNDVEVKTHITLPPEASPQHSRSFLTVYSNT